MNDLYPVGNPAGIEMTDTTEFEMEENSAYQTVRSFGQPRSVNN